MNGETYTIEQPQAGAQNAFCASPADVAIYGGAAGGGKSIGLLLEAARNIFHPKYTAAIYRRELVEITDEGGLWDSSQLVYPQLGGVPTRYNLAWNFPSGARIKFHHLEDETKVRSHQGAQYAFLGFDELTHFKEYSFFYLLSRNRAPAGYDLQCWCRATCNAETGWIADFIQWWWDRDNGYPIPERSGVIKSFTRINDRIVWVPDDWRDDFGHPAKSFTFISAKIEDNPALLKVDPNYRSNLLAMDEVSMERLLHSNWKIDYGGGMFNVKDFRKIPRHQLPNDIKTLRSWDTAATEQKDDNDPDWTAGALCGVSGGDFYIIDMLRFRKIAAKSIGTLLETAHADGSATAIAWEEEKGSAGKFNSAHLTGRLLGYESYPVSPKGDKVERAKPLASAARQGHVFIVEGDWNAAFLAEAASFPKKKRDQIDAVTQAMKVLTMQRRVWPAFSDSQCKQIDIDWTKTGSGMLNYGAYYQTRDLKVFFLAALWDSLNCILYVHAGRRYDSFLPDDMAEDTAIIAHVVERSGLNGLKPGLGKMDKLLAEDSWFEDGRNLAGYLRPALRKVGIKTGPNPAVQHDEAGAIAYAGMLFGLQVDETRYGIMVERRQPEIGGAFASWALTDTKQLPESGYCQCLLLIISELRRHIIRAAPKPIKRDYHPRYEAKEVRNTTWMGEL